MLPRASAALTRVAVVQLAYHPAIVADRRIPLEDPLHDPRAPDALLPERADLPEPLHRRLDALRAAVRAAYDEQLLLRVRAILEQCRAWGARLVVFPEYSIPWEILGGVADAGGDMVVVAGTHTVDRAARRSRIYEQLVAPEAPHLGASVCPVLHRGRLLALVPKLHPALPERESMTPGDAWAPVQVPDGLPGPMGALIGLDFLHRDSPRHRALVAPHLDGCRFFAVPSLTPAYTGPDFAGKAWEEARRHGRPVLYADGAEGGGSSIFVDEARVHDLRRFPEHAGYLEPGDEGVIVADVDLGFERPGSVARQDAPRPAIPFAEATLVYRGHPVGLAYARWLEEAAPLLERDDEDALEALVARVEQRRDELLNAGALSGAAARGRRMRRLTAEIGRVTRVEEIRKLTREVLMPAGALPLAELRLALAGAAADEIFAWLKQREARAAGFAEVEERLRKAVDQGRRSSSWTSEGVEAFARVREVFRAATGTGTGAGTGTGTEAGTEAGTGTGTETGTETGTATGAGAEADPDAEETADEPAPRVRVVAPTRIEPAALGEQRHGGWVLRFRTRPEDFRASVAVASLSAAQIREASDLFLLAVAQGAARVATVAAWPEDDAAGAALCVLRASDDDWLIETPARTGAAEEHLEPILAAVRASGLRVEAFERVAPERVAADIEGLRSRISGARGVIRAARDLRLREVEGEYVEPDARVEDGPREPILGALDAWLAGPDQVALFLGEFGMGKSTSLAVWATRRWDGGEGPWPVLVNLAGTPATRDVEGMLLEAAGAGATVPNRAAIQLLIRHGLALPMFDGFDEMATRLTAADLSGRLATLLRVAEGGGRVVIASREHYFPSEAHLRSATEAALAEALGGAAGVRRIVLQPLDERQVEALVRQVKQGPGAADEALRRITRTYDLRDLVRRPLLLGMVLATIDRIEPGATVGAADLYEAYLGRWLDQTRSGDPECLSDVQKVEFAEALADRLWRSGDASCTWEELSASVRARLARELPEHLPVGVALLEIQGGAFFVREGDDRYRFAHKSFLEYFLARALVHTLSERPAEVLDTRPISGEVAAFVGEILRRAEEPRASAPVRSVQAWLVSRGQGEGARPPEATAGAAANALRLLLGMARWSGEGSGWIPEGADLRRAPLAEQDLRGVALGRADLRGADLSAVDLREASLPGAMLDEARLVRARLDGADLRRISARGADFRRAEADRAALEGADLRGAALSASTWTRCAWGGAVLSGATRDPWIALPPPSGEGGRGAASPLPPRWAATLGDALHPSSALDWHPQGSLLASGEEGTVRVWDAASGQEVARLRIHQAPLAILSVAWDPSGQRVASASVGGVMCVWDFAQRREDFRLRGHGDAVSAGLAWSPSGEFIATAADDGTICVVAADTGAEARRIQPAHWRLARALAWSPDGQRIAGSGMNGAVRIWGAEDGGELARTKAAVGSIDALAWSPDSRFLAGAGSDGSVRIWDAARGEELAHWAAHEERAVEVVWDAHGRRIASAGGDGTVRLWDTPTGTEIARFEHGHGSVRAFAWDSWHERLASAGADAAVRVWDTDRGQLLLVLESAGEAVLARTPGGFCLLPEGDRDRISVAIRPIHAAPDRPSRRPIALPLAGLREALHRPDKVAAAFSGDLSGDDLRPELARLGFGEIPDDRDARRAARYPTFPEPRLLVAESAPARPALSTPTALSPADFPPAPPPIQAASAPAPPAAAAPAPAARALHAPRAGESPIKNPFHPGRALIDAANLPGREPVLADLLALVHSCSPAVLRGPRRAGKTSILHLLAARLAPTHDVHHRTLEATDLRTADDLARLLEPRLRSDPTPADALRARLRVSRQSVLLLDEIAHLGRAEPSLFAWLRAVGQERTAIVLVGSPWDWVQIVEHAARSPGSSFGNDVTPVTLGPLPEADALDFLVTTAPPDVPIQRDQTARWIVELCGAWPFYLQVMGYAVVQAVRLGNRRALVEAHGVSELYEQRLLLERDAGFFGTRWAELPERARRVLWQLKRSPAADLPAVRELSSEDRKILRDTGLCDAFGRWLPDRPFYDWIRRIAIDPGAG